VVIPKAIRE
jgi:hypothetical protein